MSSRTLIYRLFVGHVAHYHLDAVIIDNLLDQSVPLWLMYRDLMCLVCFVPILLYCQKLSGQSATH